MVAMPGTDTGRIIFASIWKSLAPSMYADSASSPGIPLKKFRIRNIFHAPNATGIIRTKILFYMFKVLLTSR